MHPHKRALDVLFSTVWKGREASYLYLLRHRALWELIRRDMYMYMNDNHRDAVMAALDGHSPRRNFRMLAAITLSDPVRMAMGDMPLGDNPLSSLLCAYVLAMPEGTAERLAKWCRRVVGVTMWNVYYPA